MPAQARPAYHISHSAPYSWYLNGVMLELKGNYREAYDSFKTAWELDEDAVPVLTELARVALRLNKTGEAEKWIEQALAIRPDDVKLKMMLARIYASGQQHAEAVEILEDVLKQEPDNQDALFLQGSLYAQMEKYPKAIEALKHAASQKGSRSFMAHYYLGKIYLDKAEPAKAREEFYQALQANPRFIPLYIDLALTYEAERDVENALKIWRMLLEKQPDNLRVAARVVELQLELGQIDNAVKMLEELNSSNPAITALKFKAAITCLQKKMPLKALAILEPMSGAMQGDSRLLFYTALALEQAGRIDDAINTLKSIDLNDSVGTEAAIRAAYLLQTKNEKEKSFEYLEACHRKVPDNPEIVLALARMYHQAGQIARSVALLEDYINSGGEDKEIYMQLAMTLENRGQRSRAIELALQAIELDPDYVPALNFVGYIWAEEGKNLDRAEELLNKAVEKQPDDGFVVDSLGWLYYAQGKYKKAVQQLEKAHKLVPDDPTIAEHLGDALMKIDRYYKALNVYRKALELEKNRKNRRRLNKKIKKAVDLISDMVDS